MKSILVGTLQKGFTANFANSDFYDKVCQSLSSKLGKSFLNTNFYEFEDAFYYSSLNVLFYVEANSMLLEEGKRVATYGDLSKIFQTNSKFLDFKTASSDIVLRSDEISNKDDAIILGNLIGQVKNRGLSFSPYEPLVISNLSLEEDENKTNPYGLLLKMTDSTTALNDSRFASGKENIDFGKKSLKLTTANAGLSGVFYNYKFIDIFERSVRETKKNYDMSIDACIGLNEYFIESRLIIVEDFKK